MLNGDKRSFVILTFFFDYRAGSTTANDPTGLLKMFLLQLCQGSKELERELAERNAETPIDEADVSTLLEMFTVMSKILQSDICVFVDGLDEYHGHYTDLVNTLAQIQDCVGLKLCVASRSELTFQTRYSDCPSLRMQDHNAASVRVYIDHAISKGRENMAHVDTVFDETMREQLQQRAQGVIIWARLAVDELLRAAYIDSARETLAGILEHLPDELEAMYERSISKMRHPNTMEVALILFLLNEFGGAMKIEVLYGLWHFLGSRMHEKSIPIRDITDSDKFSARLLSLVGSLLDIVRRSNEVRLMHKTLQPFLRRSVQIQDQLPSYFKERYADNVELRVYADVIEAASSEVPLTPHHMLHCVDYCAEPAQRNTQSKPRIGRLLQSPLLSIHPDWEKRIALMQQSLERLFDNARLLESRGVSSFKICEKAMSSILVIVAVTGPEEVFSSLDRAYRRGFLDLAIAIREDFRGYIKERLEHELDLVARDWSELLCKATNNQDEIRTRLLLDMLRPHCTIIYTDFLLSFGKSATYFGDVPYEWMAPMLSEMKLSPTIRKDLNMCENDTCGRGDDLIHWWTRECTSDKASRAILALILESGEGISTRCRQNGTALHILVDKCLERPSNKGLCDSTTISKFKLLAREGIDPTIKHQDHTPLQYARKSWTNVKRRGFLRGNKTLDQYYDLKVLVNALVEYEKKGKWPDYQLNRKL